MKRKVFSILFALVLVLSFSLVTAVPVAASPGLLPEVKFQEVGDGVAEWSIDKANSGTYSVLLNAGTVGGANAGRIQIDLVDPIPISEFTGVTFFVWEPTGTEHGGEYPSDIAQAYPYGDPNINIYLDFNEDGVFDDCLEGVGSVPVSEAAWPDYADQWTEMEAPYGFYDMDNSMGQGTWIAWPIVAGTLTEWKTWLATNQPLCTVVRVKITFGFWADQVTPDVYVDDVEINGVTYDLEPRVINIDTDEGFNTIQAAIDDPETVATNIITVAAGTYNERVNINKSLTLLGANHGVNATAVERGPESIINPKGLELDFGVLIDGADTTATFDGFTVENYERTGVLAGGFSVDNDPAVAHILNNIVTEPIGQHNNNCIQVGDGTTGTVIGNEVTGANLESPDWSGSGILVAGSSNVLVSENYVHDCEGGIQIVGYLQWRNAPAEDNVIEYNLVEGNHSGIVPSQYSTRTIIRYNDVLNNDDEGIAVMAIDKSYEHSTPSGTEIHFNNIVGNENYGVVSGLWGSDTGNVFPEEVDATNNWWGYSSGPTHASNPGGTGNPVTDNVAYSPWLGATFDTSPMTFIVDDVGPEPAAGYIQSAINAADTGDTINVVAGTYVENPTIGKSLTLSGPNATISPNNGGRVTEAIIDGEISVSGAFDGVTIQGFHFEVTPGEPARINCAGGFSGDDLRILRNSFTADPPTSTGQAAIAVGSGFAVEGWVIDDNLFTGVWGIQVFAPSPADNEVTITNNVIIGDSTTRAWAGIEVNRVSGNISGNKISYIKYAGINVGGVVGPCDDLTISNNTVTHAGGAGEDYKGAINMRSDCTNITITGNTLSDSYDGITIYNVGDLGTGIAVNLNNITGNSHYGVLNSADGILDAEDNWWGILNGSDIAKLVSGSVDYSPWLDAPYPDGKSTTVSVTSISLESNWNLISLPLIPDDSAIETVLAGADVTVNKVAYYTGGPEGSWLYYTGDPETSDLTQMQDGKGYWIDVNTAGALTISGYELCAPPPAVPPSYNLVEGWNLIGFKSFATDTVEAYFGTAVMDTMEAMYGYDAAAGLYTIIESTDTLVLGDGYWLAVSADGTIYP